MSVEKKPILEIQGLTVEFTTRKGIARAVEDLDLLLNHGETLGVVGESGCGKSVTALSILRLIPRPHGSIAAGSILFNGLDLVRAPDKEIRRIRGSAISMIFQEPMTSLNPIFKVGFQIEEVMRLHRGLKGRRARRAVLDVLEMVGIPDPGARFNDYPHQLSGGMRQRVMIAMALSCRPQIMIADEPTTALDVTIQAQILELMHELKDRIGMSMLLITHDLGVIAQTAQKVAVMYTGRVVEMAEVGELFEHPLHPYTRGLFESLPGKGRDKSFLQPIPGSVPNLIDLPPGVPFSGPVFPGSARLPLPGAAVGRIEDEPPGSLLESREGELMAVPILACRDLAKYYPLKKRTPILGPGREVKAVDGINLALIEGEILGLVGESGCGKSTLGRVLLGHEDPTKGTRFFFGEECG